MLGIVESPDGRQLVVADVPGLIEGASEGVGLGHEFLAHLERARTLVHVIDASKPADEQWRTIDGELTAYGAGLDELAADRRAEQDRPRAGPALRDRGRADRRCLSRLVRDRRGDRRRSRSALFALVPEPPCSRAGDEAELADFLVYRPAAEGPAAGACCAPKAASAWSDRRPARRSSSAPPRSGSDAAVPRSRSATESFEFVP